MPFLVPFLPAITAGIGAAGAALGGKKSARQQTAIEPPEFQPLRDLLIQRATERLKTPSSLPPGFLATGIQNINRESNLAQQSLENRLGGAGLLGSGIHGAGLTNLETSRLGNIAELENIGIPRLTRELANQDVDLASRVFSQRVPGTQLPGSAIGSGFGTAAELLAYLYGSGSLGGNKSSAGTTLPLMGSFAF